MTLMRIVTLSRYLLGAFALALGTSCPVDPPPFIQCSGDPDCNRFAGGTCDVYDGTGHSFCTYPDTECAGGRRWSDLDVEQPISGACVMNADAGVDAPIDAPVTIDGPPAAGWAQVFGAAGFDAASGVAVDGAGNVYVVGSFSGAVNFAGTSLVSAGMADVFVVKLDANGNRVWAKRYGGAGMDSGLGVAATADGVVVVGSFSETVDFGAGATMAQGATDGFLLAVNATGGYRWSVRAGGTDYDQLSAVAVDTAGNVAVAGEFRGTASFGGASLVAVAGDDGAVAKFSPAGAHLWSRRLGGNGMDSPAGISVLPGNDLVVAATFGGMVDLGGGPLTGTVADVWVTRVAGATGAHVWSRRYGGANSDQVKGVAPTADGFLLVGCFMQTADFGGPPLVAGMQTDAYVARYDAAGAHVWSRGFGGASADCATTAVTLPSGNALVGAFFGGQVSLAGTNLAAVGGQDLLVAELAGATGVPVAARAAGGAGADLPASLAAVGADLVLAGSTTGMADIFGHVIANGGMSDGFVVRTAR